MTKRLDELVHIPNILPLRVSVCVTLVLNDHLLSFLPLNFRLYPESVSLEYDAKMGQCLNVVEDQWWTQVEVVCEEDVSLASHLAFDTE